MNKPAIKKARTVTPFRLPFETLRDLNILAKSVNTNELLDRNKPTSSADIIVMAIMATIQDRETVYKLAQAYKEREQRIKPL